MSLTIIVCCRPATTKPFPYVYTAALPPELPCQIHNKNENPKPTLTSREAYWSRAFPCSSKIAQFFFNKSFLSMPFWRGKAPTNRATSTLVNAVFTSVVATTSVWRSVVCRKIFAVGCCQENKDVVCLAAVVSALPHCVFRLHRDGVWGFAKFYVINYCAAPTRHKRTFIWSLHKNKMIMMIDLREEGKHSHRAPSWLLWGRRPSGQCLKDAGRHELEGQRVHHEQLQKRWHRRCFLLQLETAFICNSNTSSCICRTSTHELICSRAANQWTRQKNVTEAKINQIPAAPVTRTRRGRLSKSLG